MMKYGALILLIAGCLPLFAEENIPFPDWIDGIKRQAVAQGISPATVTLLDKVKPDPRVIEFDRAQPEFVQTFDDYLRARLTDERVRIARRKFQQNRKVLEEIGDRYGVEPEYIVAFWGLESSFGEHQGKYSVLRSLATLAHDQRRPEMFTRELFAALRILDGGHIPPAEFVGGWAGAMGQNQFMPSAFLEYAQDYDGDGRKNIWTEPQDVWASIANYLHRNGWRKGAGWGTQVMLTRQVDFKVLKPEHVEEGCRALNEHTRKLSIPAWQALGVAGDFRDGPEATYAMILPEDGERIAYLAGGNFNSILSYNCANKYAVSVGMLADLVAR